MAFAFPDSYKPLLPAVGITILSLYPNVSEETTIGTANG